MTFQERYAANVEAVVRRVPVEGEHLERVSFDRGFVCVSFVPAPGYSGGRKHLLLPKRAGSSRYAILCELVEVGYTWQRYEPKSPGR